MRFCVVNLGCKVNRVESDAASAALAAEGAVASQLEDADLIVVNTCTVTGEAEKKTRKAVRRALAANGHARVVVTGCAAAIDPRAFEEMSPRVEIVGKSALLERIGDRAREAAGARNASAVPVGGEPGEASRDAWASHSAVARAGESFPTRVGVKVQDGCDNACTYCIVHVARGRARSRDADAVVAESVALARAGVREIVLTGINLASWRGLGGGAGLASLLGRLLEATSQLHADGELPCRFRVSSVEPADVDGALIEVLAGADGRVCRHLHVPLQSGSSKVLAEMARPYDADAFEALVARLRADVPQIALTTDIIAGFPGETDGDFAETLAVARRCGFSRIHAFPYSRREGTPAAARADQVPPDVKAARAAALRALGARLRDDDYARRAGTVELALVEDGERAMTESYYEVAAPAGAARGALVALELPRDRHARPAAAASAAAGPAGSPKGEDAR